MRKNRDAEYRRRAISTRRLGQAGKCVYCDEDRPAALIRRSNPRICICCQRQQQGKAVFDRHHVAGKNNHAGTIPIPVNDHRTLSEAQFSWPVKTLRNPGGSPLLAAAACIRGFIILMEYCLNVFLRWIAEFLEDLDEYLLQELGPRWWKDLKHKSPGDRPE